MSCQQVAIGAVLAAEWIQTMLSNTSLGSCLGAGEALVHCSGTHSSHGPSLCLRRWTGGGVLEEALLAPGSAPAVLDEPVVLTLLCGVIAHDNNCMVQRVRAASRDVCKQPSLSSDLGAGRQSISAFGEPVFIVRRP